MNGRIKEYMTARGWSEYKLAQMSGLSQSTVANLFRRNTVPSISTLESICGALGITLSLFFAESKMIELSSENSELLAHWALLDTKQKELIIAIMENMK